MMGLLGGTSRQMPVSRLGYRCLLLDLFDPVAARFIFFFAPERQ